MHLGFQMTNYPNCLSVSLILVNLEVKNGRVGVISNVEKPITLNKTRVDLAFLAAATTPYASISPPQKVDNQTAREPASGPD